MADSCARAQQHGQRRCFVALLVVASQPHSASTHMAWDAEGGRAWSSAPSPLNVRASLATAAPGLRSAGSAAVACRAQSPFSRCERGGCTGDDTCRIGRGLPGCC